MDFFHCNNCYLQPGPPENRTFWLTSCGHSFCSECADTNDSKCRSCLNECQYLPIDDNMPESVKQYFCDPVKELKKTLKILVIQNKQCKIYMEEYVPKLECKYAQAKMEIANKESDFGKMKKTLENKEAEIQCLHAQIAMLKAELDDERKKHGSLQHHQMEKYSPMLLSSPSSFDSNQEEFFTPKSSASKNSSFDNMNRQSSNTFRSCLTPSPPGSEKRKLTAMELLFKNKEAALRQCDRTPRTPSIRSNQTFNMSVVTPPSRISQCDRTPRTPSIRSNQTFNMSAVTPPSRISQCDRAPRTPSVRSNETFNMSVVTPPSRIIQCDRTPRTPSIRSNQTFNMSVVTPPSRNLQQRNTGMMSYTTSPSPFKSNYFQRTGSEIYNSDDSQVPFSDAQRMPSLMEIKMRHHQRPSNESYSSDDSQAPFSDAQRMPSPMEMKMRHQQRPSNESGRQFFQE